MGQISLDDVADEAGVGRPVIHGYFADVRELQAAVYQRVARGIAESAKDVVQTDLDLPLEERMRRNTDAWLDFVEANRAALIVLLWSDGPADASLAGLKDEVTEAMIDRVLINHLGTTEVPEAVRFVLRSFGGRVGAALREWLLLGRATRAQTHALLTAGLLSTIQQVVPAVLESSDRT